MLNNFNLLNEINYLTCFLIIFITNYIFNTSENVNAKV